MNRILMFASLMLWAAAAVADKIYLLVMAVL